MRWRQWNASQELGFASRMCAWRRRACKDRVVLSAMCTRTHLQRTAVVPAQPVPSPTTPHHSTVQHSHHRQTHTFTPQQASMPSQTKPHRNRHKNQQHHRDRRHTCPDAPEQARPLVLPPAPSCISVSLSLSRLYIAYTCSFHSSNTISCPTPPPPNNKSKRHTDMRTKIEIFIAPPSSL